MPVHWLCVSVEEVRKIVGSKLSLVVSTLSMLYTFNVLRSFAILCSCMSLFFSSESVLEYMLNKSCSFAAGGSMFYSHSSAPFLSLFFCF